MSPRKEGTDFAPAGRATPEEIERQARLFEGGKVLGLMPEAVPCMLLVVNRQRQIVFANQRLMDTLPPEQRRISVLGRRPGEILSCVHAADGEDGCGTTESCSMCGAVKAVLSSLDGGADVQECRILREQDGEALDLRVWATPVVIAGEPFSIVAALDISDEKRRQALEHIFLHDIYNVAYGLSWYADFFRNADPSKTEEYADAIERLSRELIDEIDGQRLLLKAESGELVPRPESLNSGLLVRGTVELYSRHPASHDRLLRADEQVHDITLVSDRTLLSRVLSNMVKNALEASRAGEIVTVGCTAPDSTADFWVHNPGYVPREVQLQIFQRSFSTKGRGRGLGTYSIKLLTERYLKGTVSFTSTPEGGTTFHVHHPLTPIRQMPESRSS